MVSIWKVLTSQIVNVLLNLLTYEASTLKSQKRIVEILSKRT